MVSRHWYRYVAALAVTLLLVATAIPPSATPAHTTPAPAQTPVAVSLRSAVGPSGSTVPVAPDPPGAPTPFAGGTPTWTDLSATAGAPPPRISGGLVYDGEDGYTILFGGEYLNSSTFSEQYYNDTWEFSGGKWTNITTTPSPSARFGFGIAFDPLAGEVILFGGRNAGGWALNDTWEFSGGRWSNLSISQAPGQRWWPSMTYDSATSDIVLFGGDDPLANDLNDTWTFSSGAWTKATPTHHPQSRHGATFMDDPQDSDALLFGGLGADYYNTTWEWSGTDWANVTSSLQSTINPDGRVGGGGAFDTALNVAVMYGGYPSSNYPFGTWFFSNLSWTLYNNLPNSPQIYTVWDQLTYDATDSWIVYFVPDSNQTFVFNETSGGGTSGLQVSATATPLSGIAPLTVSLSATTSGGSPPYNVTWSLGNGSSVFVANASVTYSTPGTYDLTIAVRDSGSGHYSENWTVDVSAPALQATASAVPSVATIGQNVTFRSTYSGGWPPYHFNWSFGDGGHATTQNASHSYGSAATYDVAYEISATIGGSVYVNFTENVTATVPPLTLTADVTPTSGVAPVTVTATSSPSGGEPPYAYRWTWGDGSAVATTENATHTYGSPGSYVVSVNVSEFRGSSVEKTWTVTVVAPLSVAISANPQAASVGAAVTFLSTPSGGAPPYAYHWSFGDGQSATTQDATHAFQSSGVFVVNLTLTDASGQSARASVTVPVNASAAGTTSQSGTFTVTDWLAVALVVIIIAMLLLFVVSRRRKNQPPASPPTVSGEPPAPPNS